MRAKIDDEWKSPEEELQIALAISLSISETGVHRAESSRQISPSPASQSEEEYTITPVEVKKVIARWDFDTTKDEELSFRAGDVITVIGARYKDWWKGSLGSQTGIFPLNYVEALEEEEDVNGAESPLTPRKSGKISNHSKEEECLVCFDGPPDHCLIPCGHTGLCAVCVKQMKLCPFCKVDVERVQKLWKI